jgi:putative CocE/NonD family hydrolase
MRRYARRYGGLAVVLLALLILTVAVGHAEPQRQEKVSAPGQYSGYTSPDYPSHTTTSQYVTMRDGVRIAVDVHIPTGGPAQDKFPTVLVMTPYHRASVTDEGVQDYLSSPTSEFLFVNSYGYVIVVADVRGTGASFGYRSAVFPPAEQADTNDLINWIVDQPWSDGNVGMMGQSYLATSQYLAAAQGNPALKCIAPRYSLLDLYDVVYPGGVLDTLFIQRYKLLTGLLDLNLTDPASGIWPSKPVDEDTDGSLLDQASAEHVQNFDMTATAPLVPFRDSTFVAGDGTTLSYDDLSVSGHLQEIEDSGVAIYHMGGWFDGYTRDTLTMQATMKNPSKTIMWPYNHLQLRDLPAGSPDLEMSNIEHVRWFDWCLKGIDNGIDKEPAYYFYTMGKNEWRFSDQWPLPEEKPTPYYLAADQTLTTTAPAEADVFDEYVTDYSASSGSGTRWLCLTGGNCEYGNRAVLDKKNLTYTTAPLEQDLEVTGHPIAHLFLSSTATDGALFVYLEDVDENGVVTYVTEGELKLSLRKLQPRPWLPDLPWVRAYEEDEAPLTPGQVEEIVLDLQPTSYVFPAGHQLRISIAGWDNTNFEGPRFDPPPTLQMYRDVYHMSYVELPVIGTQAPAQPTSTPPTQASPTATIEPPAPTATAQAPAASPTGTVVAPPSSGRGAVDSGSGWTPVAWLLLGVGAATAVAGGVYVRRGRRSRGSM